VTMCTPRPERALRYAGRVATSVLPSPVRISENLAVVQDHPPISCTSKWRMLSTRLAASRTTAKDSGRSSASAAFSAASRAFFGDALDPFRETLSQLECLSRQGLSGSATIDGSRALIARTTCRIA